MTLTCDYCGAPLTVPHIWRGRVTMMEDAGGYVRPHQCEGTGIIMSDRPCELCGKAPTSHCLSYYLPEGGELEYDDWLCGECHHGGPKKTAKDPIVPEERPV